MTDEAEDDYPFEGILARIQRVEAEIKRRYPDLQPGPFLIIMGDTVPSYAALLARTIASIQDSQAQFVDACQRNKQEIDRVVEAFQAMYDKPIARPELIPQVKPRPRNEFLAELMEFSILPKTKKKRGRKGQGHQAARNRIICKEAYTLPQIKKEF